MDGYSDQIILSETKWMLHWDWWYVSVHTHGQRQVYGSSMDGIGSANWYHLIKDIIETHIL